MENKIISTEKHIFGDILKSHNQDSTDTNKIKESIPLYLSKKEVDQLHSGFYPIEKCRSLIVNDIWMRWNEFSTDKFTSWKFVNLLEDEASKRALLPPDRDSRINSKNNENEPSAREQEQNFVDVSSSYISGSLFGFIKPSNEKEIKAVDVLSSTDFLQKVTQPTIEAGFIYPREVQSYVNVKRTREISPYIFDRVFEETKKSYPKQLVKYPGHYKLNLTVVEASNGFKPVDTITAYVDRLEHLAGTTAFKIPQNHKLYDSLIKNKNKFKIVHPLDLTPRFNYKYSAPLVNRYLPIVADPDTSPQNTEIRPVVPVHKYDDYKIALLENLPLPRVITGNGLSCFKQYIDLLSAVEMVENDQCAVNEPYTRANYIKLFPGRATVPISIANEAIYKFLAKSLTHVDPESSEYKYYYDPKVIPGIIEPMVTGSWFLNVNKVYPYLEKYYENKSKSISSNITEKYELEEFKNIEDFPITFRARSGLTSEDFGLSEQNYKDNLSKYFFNPIVWEKTVLTRWAAQLYFSLLRQSNTLSVAGEDPMPDFKSFFPLHLTESSSTLKQILFLTALTANSMIKYPVEEQTKVEELARDSSINACCESLLDSVVLGQRLIGPGGFDASTGWTLYQLVGFRLGRLVSELTPSEGKYRVTSDEEGQNKPKKSYDQIRGVMVESLAPSNDPFYVSESVFEEQLNLLAALYKIQDREYLIDKKENPNLVRSTKIKKEIFEEHAAQFEKYILFVLQQYERDICLLMSRKRYYEAKQVVDNAILKTTGHYLPVFFVKSLNSANFSPERLETMRLIYQCVTRTICRMAYPFYPFISEAMFYSLYPGTKDAESHRKALALQSESAAVLKWEKHQIDNDTKSALDALNEILSNKRLLDTETEETSTQTSSAVSKSENNKTKASTTIMIQTRDSVQSFLGGVKLSTQRDYLPGKLMFDIIDAISSFSMQQKGNLTTQNTRCYLVLKGNARNSSLFGSSEDDPSSFFNRYFSIYTDMKDVEENFCSPIGLVCKLGAFRVAQVSFFCLLGILFSKFSF